MVKLKLRQPTYQKMSGWNWGWPINIVNGPGQAQGKPAWASVGSIRFFGPDPSTSTASKWDPFLGHTTCIRSKYQNGLNC